MQASRRRLGGFAPWVLTSAGIVSSLQKKVAVASLLDESQRASELVHALEFGGDGVEQRLRIRRLLLQRERTETFFLRLG
jgi:hypothetical protein